MRIASVPGSGLISFSHVEASPHPYHRYAMIRPLPARGARLAKAQAALFPLSPRAGRGRIALAIRVRGRLRKCGRNRFKHAGHVAQHVVVPKSQDSIIVVCKPFVANRVARVVRVLPPINFNDETTFTANQVDRIGTNRLLPNELAAIEPARSKSVPKCCFRVGGGFAQPSGSPGFDLISFSHVEASPHPYHRYAMIRPLPARGARLASRVLQ